MELTELGGSFPKGFTIEELTEVYLEDEQGEKCKSIGFFKNENIAKGFAGLQTDANWHKTKKYFVFTDGKAGFLIGERIILIDDEVAALQIKKNALSKLSEEEKAILKL
jgi:hypothetical protein